MHWSRELLALTAGARWRIAGLVVIGLLIVAASLASFVCAGRAIAAVFAGHAWRDFWFLIAGAAVAAVVRGVLLHLRETTGERTAAGAPGTLALSQGHQQQWQLALARLRQLCGTRAG